MATIKENAVVARNEDHEKWADDSDDQGRVFLKIDLSPEANALLDDLAHKIHGTKGEVFRRAVGLFKLAIDAVEQGKRVGAVDTDQELDTEFVGIVNG